MKMIRPARTPGTIVAVGGGLASATGKVPYGFLSAITTDFGGWHPKLIHLGTASGDSADKERQVDQVLCDAGLLGKPIEHVRLTKRRYAQDELDEIFADVDLVVVSSGNTVAALRWWHQTGVAERLVTAHSTGAACLGSSAGALCWFEQLVTDSFGALSVVDGLGVLPGIAAAHFSPGGEAAGLMAEVVTQGNLTANVGFGIVERSAIVFKADSSVAALNLGQDKSVRLIVESTGVKIDVLPDFPVNVAA